MKTFVYDVVFIQPLEKLELTPLRTPGLVLSAGFGCTGQVMLGEMLRSLGKQQGSFTGLGFLPWDRVELFGLDFAGVTPAVACGIKIRLLSSYSTTEVKSEF